MKSLFLFLFLLITPLALFAQNAKIDSLKRVIATTKVDSVKGRTLCRLCGELRKAGNHAEALNAGNRGLELSRRVGDRKNIASCLNNIGNVHVIQGETDHALDYYQRSLTIDEEIGNQSGEANSLHNIGNIYESQGDYPRALDFYQRSLRIYEEMGSRKGMANSFYSIGLIHSNQGSFAHALDYYQRSLKIEEELGDREGVAASLSNIGNIYVSQRDFARALVYYQRGLKIQEEIGDREGVAGSLSNIGNILGSQGDYSKALACFQRSLKIFEEIGDPAGMGHCLNNIGMIHFSLYDYVNAHRHYHQCLKIFEEIGDQVGITHGLINIGIVSLKLGRPDSARYFAGKGIKLAQEIGQMESKQGGAQILYQADSALGNWKGAFDAHRLFKIYSDSLKNDEQSKELGRLEAEYEADKEREVLEERQAAELSRRNWMTGSAFGGIALSLVIAYTLFRGRQKEKKANAELRILNDEIKQQKNEIEAQHDEISRQNTEITERNEEISKQNETLEQQSRQLAETNERLAEKNLRLKLAQEQLVLEHEQREQAQRMAGIGEVSTIVAHEVNTPLGAIKAGAQNLIDRLSQNSIAPELKPLIDRAALSQPLSSREERAALRQLEPRCEAAGFAKPEEAARQLVNCGLYDLEDAETLSLLAREPQMLAQLANTGAFMAQAANIQRAAERAATIVSALKTYSTLAGGPSDENAGASVADTLGLVLKLYDYYLSQGIELKIDSMEGLPDVTLDASALSQVWTKLLLNSIYGMNRKGKLEIKFIVTERHLRVLWLDNGPSPSDEAMARAFEPGVALRETDPPIDLWLCCAFIEGEAGGRIMASIPTDGGLVVELLLPKAE